MRLMTALSIGAAVAMAFTFTAVSSADAKRASAKQCQGTTLDNKKVSFRCKSNERCCFSVVLAQGTCQPSSMACGLGQVPILGTLLAPPAPAKKK